MSSEAQFLTREQLLSPPALDEKVVSFPDWGDVLCVELSGDDRAQVTEALAESSQPGPNGEKAKVDLRGYQKTLLQKGIADPGSPEGARVPLLRDSDVASFMQKAGGGKVRDLVDAIEALSGMGVKAVEVASKNSVSPATVVGGTS
jgi:hypothetical protein